MPGFEAVREKGRTDSAQARLRPSGKDVCGGDGEGQEERGLVKLGRAPAADGGDPTRAAESPLPLYVSFFFLLSLNCSFCIQKQSLLTA